MGISWKCVTNSNGDALSYLALLDRDPEKMWAEVTIEIENDGYGNLEEYVAVYICTTMTREYHSGWNIEDDVDECFELGKKYVEALYEVLQ